MNIKSKTIKLLFALILHSFYCTHGSTKKIPKLEIKKIISESTPLLSFIHKESPRKKAEASLKNLKKVKSISEPAPKKQPFNKKEKEDKVLSIRDIKARYWQAQRDIKEQKEVAKKNTKQ